MAFMITELSLLKACLKKENFELIYPHINKEVYASETRQILSHIERIYASSVDHIPVENITDIYVNRIDKNADKNVLLSLIQNIKNTPDCLVNDIVKHYAKKELILQLQQDHLDDNQMRSFVQRFEEKLTATSEWQIADNSATSVFSPVLLKGLEWRLSILRNGIGSLRKGDFGIVGAFVDTGKTSFLCSELTHFAKQVSDDKPIIYFNNEGSADRIQRRLWSCALNISTYEILENPKSYEAAYAKAIGGMNKILVVNVSGKHAKDIEKFVKQHTPSIIVFDQLDHVSGFEKKSALPVDRLKHLYQWARELASENCPALAVSQCDRTVMKGSVSEQVETQKYIGMHQLDGSKIAKQSAADFIITIGCDLNAENIRYINIPKNKLHGRKLKLPVNYDPITGRYTDGVSI